MVGSTVVTSLSSMPTRVASQVRDKDEDEHEDERSKVKDGKQSIA